MIEALSLSTLQLDSTLKLPGRAEDVPRGGASRMSRRLPQTLAEEYYRL
jgi:hypothetical protein